MITNSRIAHLGTSSKRGYPHVVPICYAYDGVSIYSSIDEKPKRAKPNRLRRILNITENSHICLIVDEYDEDWSKLRYVIVRGFAQIVAENEEHKRAVSLLRAKYIQYRSMKFEGRPVIKIIPVNVTAWKAGSA